MRLLGFLLTVSTVHACPAPSQGVFERVPVWETGTHMGACVCVTGHTRVHARPSEVLILPCVGNNICVDFHSHCEFTD